MNNSAKEILITHYHPELNGRLFKNQTHLAEEIVKTETSGEYYIPESDTYKYTQKVNSVKSALSVLFNNPKSSYSSLKKAILALIEIKYKESSIYSEIVSQLAISFDGDNTIHLSNKPTDVIQIELRELLNKPGEFFIITDRPAETLANVRGDSNSQLFRDNTVKNLQLTNPEEVDYSQIQSRYFFLMSTKKHCLTFWQELRDYVIIELNKENEDRKKNKEIADERLKAINENHLLKVAVLENEELVIFPILMVRLNETSELKGYANFSFYKNEPSIFPLLNVTVINWFTFTFPKIGRGEIQTTEVKFSDLIIKDTFYQKTEW